MDYDKILIATGGSPNKPDIKGNDANYVYYLRNADDQQKIKERAKEVKNAIVVVGGGFISSEAAASLAMKYSKDIDIHLVSG